MLKSQDRENNKCSFMETNDKSHFGLDQTAYNPGAWAKGTFSVSDAIGEARTETENRTLALNLNRKVAFFPSVYFGLPWTILLKSSILQSIN